jgi:endogenous inhibitor of DNA gyrase (YacG/DUF329 family)
MKAQIAAKSKTLQMARPGCAVSLSLTGAVRLPGRAFCFGDNEMASDSTCPECGRVLKSPLGLAIHLSNVHGKKQSTWTEVPCTACGKLKRVAPCHIRRSAFVFCSVECANKWRGERERGENNPGFTSRYVPCTQCGKPILRQPNEIERAQTPFCDHECYGKWLSENRTGEGHSAWIDGRSYANGMRSTRKWATAVLARAGQRCEKCGSSRCVVAHHIKTRLEHPELRNDLANGQALCRSCHSKAHGLRPDPAKSWATRRANAVIPGGTR